MVRYEGKPAMPYDQYALALRPLERVYWSTVGAGGESSVAERAHVIDLARRNPNIVGLFMDDFFHASKHEGDLGVLSIEQLLQLKGEMQAAERPLTLGVTLYTHQLDMPLAPYLALCDDVSLWTWNAPELVDMEANMAKLEALLEVFSVGQLTDSDHRCLKLAREQLGQLQAKNQGVATADLKEILRRLDDADQLSQDDPDRAQAVRRGVIELYGDKPWAESAVTRARAALQP